MQLTRRACTHGPGNANCGLHRIASRDSAQAWIEHFLCYNLCTLIILGRMLNALYTQTNHRRLTTAVVPHVAVPKFVALLGAVEQRENAQAAVHGAGLRSGGLRSDARSGVTPRLAPPSCDGSGGCGLPVDDRWRRGARAPPPPPLLAVEELLPCEPVRALAAGVAAAVLA
eukprot:COSAG05_NODE_6194_length_1002_cov_1.573643_1_plen_170_part_10